MCFLSEVVAASQSDPAPLVVWPVCRLLDPHAIVNTGLKRLLPAEITAKHLLLNIGVDLSHLSTKTIFGTVIGKRLQEV